MAAIENTTQWQSCCLTALRKTPDENTSLPSHLVFLPQSSSVVSVEMDLHPHGFSGGSP